MLSVFLYGSDALQSCVPPIAAMDSLGGRLYRVVWQQGTLEQVVVCDESIITTWFILIRLRSTTRQQAWSVFAFAWTPEWPQCQAMIRHARVG